tara:strand:+ start:6708 stop:7151 length:444 start_codon:yes stop_codon:yes gene_type:complete
MPEINKTLLVPYTAEQMYHVVNNVQEYPEFLPWCEDTIIQERNDIHQVASILLVWMGLKKKFTTKNTMTYAKEIILELVDGPFSEFLGDWKFEDLGDVGSKVIFKLNFKFSTGILDLAFNKVFTNISKDMVDAFYHRAKHIYGEKDL